MGSLRSGSWKTARRVHATRLVPGSDFRCVTCRVARGGYPPPALTEPSRPGARSSPRSVPYGASLAFDSPLHLRLPPDVPSRATRRAPAFSASHLRPWPVLSGQRPCLFSVGFPPSGSPEDLDPALRLFLTSYSTPMPGALPGFRLSASPWARHVARPKPGCHGPRVCQPNRTVRTCHVGVGFLAALGRWVVWVLAASIKVCRKGPTTQRRNTSKDSTPKCTPINGRAKLRSTGNDARGLLNLGTAELRNPRTRNPSFTHRCTEVHRGGKLIVVRSVLPLPALGHSSPRRPGLSTADTSRLPLASPTTPSRTKRTPGSLRID
jgi:hypothetical protein